MGLGILRWWLNVMLLKRGLQAKRGVLRPHHVNHEEFLTHSVSNNEIKQRKFSSLIVKKVFCVEAQCNDIIQYISHIL